MPTPKIKRINKRHGVRITLAGGSSITVWITRPPSFLLKNYLVWEKLFNYGSNYKGFGIGIYDGIRICLVSPLKLKK